MVQSSVDETHYTVLELAQGPRATQDDIRKAFYRLARTHHPDKGGSEEAFARLQLAAATLLDPRKKQVYDGQIAAGLPVSDEKATGLWPQDPPPSQHQHEAAVSLADVWDSDTEDDSGAARNDTQHTNQGGSQRTQQGASTRVEADLVGEQLSGQVQGALLDLLRAQGLRCDAATQLVVTCELCQRPATRTCWICQCDLCEFCTRTPHTKGEWGLHWPLINAPGSLSHSLAQKEFEQKRLEDAKRYEESQPGHVSQSQRDVIRIFREDSLRARGEEEQGLLARGGALPPATAKLACHYLWTQTDDTIHVAVHLPDGTPERPPCIDLQPNGVLCVWSTDTHTDITAASSTTQTLALHRAGQAGRPQPASPRCFVVRRRLARGVDMSMPIEVMRSGDGRYAVLVIAKAEPSHTWRCLFQGDTDGFRSTSSGGPTRAQHSLTQDRDEVVLEWSVPHWVRSDDVQCSFTCEGLRVKVSSVMDVSRTFWAPKAAASGQGASTAAPPVPPPLVNADMRTWTLSDPPKPTATAAASTGTRRPDRVLTVNLPLRDLTHEERQYKHGVRQDHRVAQRRDGGEGGAVFLQEDEDEWGLTHVLQASVFRTQGKVFVSTATHGGSALPGRWCTAVCDLPQAAQRWLASQDKATQDNNTREQ